MARAVGLMPRDVRTNSSSLKRWRRRSSRLLAEGCVIPTLAAALVTLRSPASASNNTSSPRSKRARFVGMIFSVAMEGIPKIHLWNTTCQLSSPHSPRRSLCLVARSPAGRSPRGSSPRVSRRRTWPCLTH